jgi:hypothetical protein
LTGRPAWENLRLLADCLLWAAARTLQKYVAQIYRRAIFLQGASYALILTKIDLATIWKTFSQTQLVTLFFCQSFNKTPNIDHNFHLMHAKTIIRGRFLKKLSVETCKTLTKLARLRKM